MTVNRQLPGFRVLIWTIRLMGRRVNDHSYPPSGKGLFPSHSLATLGSVRYSTHTQWALTSMGPALPGPRGHTFPVLPGHLTNISRAALQSPTSPPVVTLQCSYHRYHAPELHRGEHPDEHDHLYLFLTGRSTVACRRPNIALRSSVPGYADLPIRHRWLSLTRNCPISIGLVEILL